jgi:hypothetical protein
MHPTISYYLARAAGRAAAREALERAPISPVA